MEPPDRDSLRIALQNDGRLTDRSVGMLRDVGLRFESHDRRLFTRCRNFDLELLFIRDDDIPEYVQDGVADLGIVGRNVAVETGARLEEMKELGFGYCALTLAVPRESPVRRPEQLEGARIVTTHPSSLRRWLEDRDIAARVVEIRGAAEIAPALDVADAICDLVSTGTTLRMNDLRPLTELWQSQAVLVGNPESLADEGRSRLIDRLVTRVDGLLTADQLKYVTLNCPRDALPRILEILPGMKSPTVVPLAQEGMVAVHAAVAEEVFWEVMERLEEAGGSEILVLPVEKVLR